MRRVRLRGRWLGRLGLTAAVLAAAGGAVAQVVPSSVHPLHRPFDRLLDTYVRDGFVYYNALRIERAQLDRYVAALNGPQALALANGTPDEQKALWINAYNALVLKTVVDHYPIRGRATEYPPSSIRQIPGAFEKPLHRVAGHAVSLDTIEKERLAAFDDARVFLALGRGAYGGGRLRSEAFDGPSMDRLLDAVAAESAVRNVLVRVEMPTNRLSVSPLFSWRDAAFVSSFADRAPARYQQRSPLERAVLALVEPHVPTPEAEFLKQNTFEMRFHEFDWRLNDLNARAP